MTPFRFSLMALFTGALSGAGVAVVMGWSGSGPDRWRLRRA
ncbi:hypothetical protein [Parasynechococcus sp.]